MQADRTKAFLQRTVKERSMCMLYYSLVFLVVASIVSILNLVGVSSVTIQIAWILFMGGVALVVIQAVIGRIARVA
jgi:uncharacterized membrane protein YtjA (UPF0391 family)